MTTKVLITDYVWPSTDPERKVLEAAGIELIIAPDTSEATLSELAKDVDAIMFCFAQVTAKVLEAATNCKIAARYGIGVDNVDIAKATELGIVVTNVPDFIHKHPKDKVVKSFFTILTGLPEIQPKPSRDYDFLGLKITKSIFFQLFYNKIP